ncbi:MAG: hypothetical protein FWG02_06870 [Holophagaceae bacterium]|nr:hypothetical protein [Holophagaceae bacterium]
MEVYSVIHNRRGRIQADAALNAIQFNSPINFFNTTDTPFFQTFAELKQTYKTHFTDTFVLATNATHTVNGKILTSDRGFSTFADKNPENIVFFR